MAQGRIIVNAIAADRKINNLSDDTSRLAFTWLITFADCEGRTYGDPAVVRSMLFPRRDDITIDRMEKYIREWADAGLIVWYETSGDTWISFCKFDKNQPGLRKDREAPSRIPHPPVIDADKIQNNSGVTPELLPVKLKEVKGEERIDPTPTSPADWMTPQMEAQRIIQQVTNLAASPPDQIEKYTELILRLKDQHNSHTVDYLKPFYDDWCGRKTKDGKPYKRTALGWVEWALEGSAPEPAKQQTRRRKPVEVD